MKTWTISFHHRQHKTLKKIADSIVKHIHGWDISSDLDNKHKVMFVHSSAKVKSMKDDTFSFIRTISFWLSLSVLIVFSNFRPICSYFVLVTILIFDLALHICIFIIHAEYFWLVMAGLKETFYILILKFVYITFCLLTEPRSMLQLKFFMA